MSILSRHVAILPSTSEASSSKVGVEIEFVGIGVRRAAEALARGLGGRLREEDPQACHILGSRIGDARVELDVRHVHPHRGAANPLHGAPTSVPIWLGRLLSPLVPRELIVGPLARSELGLVDEAVRTLHDAGARGDGANLLGSLGLHFNVEEQGEDPRRIVALFKAFLVLEPWLRRETGSSALARAHAPPPYPEDYVRRVLAPEYWPDLEAFTHDYVGANPTRKRSLDLLPLLLHHSPDRLLPRFAGKVKRRPAFHYRLPHAHVGRSGWSIAPEWDRWNAVERLGGEIERLEAMAARSLRGEFIGVGAF